MAENTAKNSYDETPIKAIYDEAYNASIRDHESSLVTLEYEGCPITFSLDGELMVNATQMAKKFGKRPNDWLRLDTTQDYIQALSDTLSERNTPIVLTKRGNFGDSTEQGTWLHELAALEFARWLEPKFAVWCNIQIRQLLTKGVPDQPITSTPNKSDRQDLFEVQTYAIEYARKALRLNDASYLGMLEQAYTPLGLQLPAYVDSKGVLKSATALLKEIGATISAAKFNKLLAEQGYISYAERSTSKGGVKKFPNITEKGLPYGENKVSPKNQKETQALWYADKFRELYSIIVIA